jgi:hypothetical protein
MGSTLRRRRLPSNPKLNVKKYQVFLREVFTYQAIYACMDSK